MNTRPSTLLIAVVLALVMVASATASQLTPKEWKAAEKDLKRALAAGDTGAIASAIAVIGTDDSKRAVKMLLAIGLQLDDSAVFAASKVALSDMREPEAITEMLRGLKKRDWRIRVLLIECLADVPGDEITSALGKRCSDDDVPYVVSAAAKALGARGEMVAIDDLIAALERLEKEEGVVWRDVRQALTQLTGHDFPSALDWKNFWEPRRDTFDDSQRGDKSDASTRERNAPNFFSEEIVSKRILFILDISGSMQAEDPPQGDKPGGKRLERAKSELVKVLKALSPKVKFNIIAFSDAVRSWQKTRIVPCSAANRASAIKWVTALQPGGLTSTDKALEEGFKNNQINTIFLLSDGAPANASANPFGPDKINELVEWVKNANRFRHVRLDTFGFEGVGQAPGGNIFVDFLKKLAEDNDGKFHSI